MIHPKPLSSKVFTSALLVAFFAFGLVLVGSPSKASADTNDCSDVFTPLSSSVTSGVNANKNDYVNAMNATGVPWEMFAAIHYRESNFSHSNPSNGMGIFQDNNSSNGVSLAPGPVSESTFYQELLNLGNELQNDYVNRGSVPRVRRQLQPNESDITIVKDTLFSYNGRASSYANQAASYGYSSTVQPYEGSPYVMNRFDCTRARMGIITQDGGGISGTDTRYGAFTIFARLRGDSYWQNLQSPYVWQLTGQYAYTDQTKTVGAGTNSVFAGKKIYVGFQARNMGNFTWTNSGPNPVDVGASDPTDRNSPFCDQATWAGCNRPAHMVESSVAPGQVGTFEFWMDMPQQAGTFQEHFDLVSEGRAWFNSTGFNFNITVVLPVYSWQPAGQYAYTDQTKTVGAGTTNTLPGNRVYVGIQARNTGNMTWTNSGPNQVNLGTIRPTDRTSNFYDPSWLGPNRPAHMVESSVAPGQVGTFEFWMDMPNKPGTYNEYFAPVSEQTSWMNDPGVNFYITIAQPIYSWQLTGQYAYTDQTKTTGLGTTNLTPGQRVYVGFKARNTGNMTWTNSGSNPVNVGMTRPIDRFSAFYDPSWLGPNRPAHMVESSVAPGQVGTFEFWMKAPNATGVSLEYFDLVREGIAWMNDPGLNFYMSTR